MVNFLILLQSFVDDLLNWANRPEERPAAIIVLIRLMAEFNITETVVLKRVPDNLYVTVVQEEVVTSILRHVWSNRNWIFVWTEDQEILLDLAAEFSNNRSLDRLLLLILL